MRWASYIGWLIPGLVALLGTVVLKIWLFHDPVPDLVMHVPGMDGEPAPGTVVATVQIGSDFRAGDGLPSADPGSWPGFRGAVSRHGDTDAVALADRWEDDQPRVQWQIALGEGHAGAAIHRGRVYVLDYDETLRRDVLRCLSLDDGREIWQRGYRVEVARNHGMSRTVPAVTDRHVVTIGPRCHVMCVDAGSGDLLWGIDLVAEYGTEIPMWYAGQCPLIVDDVAILAPAGDAVLLMGVSCATGEVLWKTPNIHELGMSHASITPAVIAGVSQFIYAGLGGMAGVAAEGERTGELLWFAPQWDRSVIAPSPVHLGNGRILVTAGYGGGSMLLNVTCQGGTFQVETLDTFRANQGLASEQQTPVLAGGLLFGVLPNDAGPLRNQLVCVNPDNVRDYLWTSGRERRFGLGPYLHADGKLYVLSDDGILHMLEATAGGYRERGRKQILDGHDAWGPMALAAGRLVLRDDTRMVCVDLRQGIPDETQDKTQDEP
jgi:outer membrane protein assembly factor BamB